MDKRIILIKAKIDCPVCYSGNYFDFAKDSLFECEDCGFVLIDKDLLSHNLEKSNECLFCNYNRFYQNKLFFFFKSDAITCYVCEAEYYDFTPSKIDKSYKLTNDAVAKDSKQAKILKDRVNSYYQ